MYGIAPIFRPGFGLARVKDMAAPPSRTPRRPSPRAEAGAWRGQPHEAATIEAVRGYVETTAWPYAEISARTGVGRATICRWTQDAGWRRPVGAPRSTDTAPSAKASHRMRARTLHRRIQDIAERALAELEEAAAETGGHAGADLGTLYTALEMVKAAKLARMPKKRVRRCEGAPDARPDWPAFRAPAPTPDVDAPLPSPHLPGVAERARLLVETSRVRPGRRSKTEHEEGRLTSQPKLRPWISRREAAHRRMLEGL